MQQFCYNYVTWIQTFFVYIKADDIYKDITKDVQARFDTSNDELKRLLPKEKSKKVNGLMKDELNGKVMK